MSLLDIRGQITFLYFDDMPAAFDFFENVLELPLISEQNGDQTQTSPWTRIYQTSTTTFIGAVDHRTGSVKATYRDGVLNSLVIKNFDEMAKRLEAKGIEFTVKPFYFEEQQIKTMMFYGPEGYLFEVEEFMSPEDRAAFYGEA